MPTRIDGSSPAVVIPEHDADAETVERAAPKPETNQLDGWSSSAADAAVMSIESSYGWGFRPDMEAIDADFSKLDGFALLKTLDQLERHDQLESILNRMTVDGRQRLINQAIKGNLLARDRHDRLEPQFELPGALQKMVDELNTLASRAKPNAPLTYNWSSYQEDVYDVAKRRFADQIPSLQPGDSIEMDARIGVAGHVFGGSTEAIVSVKRGADGIYTVSSEVGVDAGLEEHLTGLEGKLGGAVRVEYRFDSPVEAKAAAELFATMPPEAVERFGRPAAFELRGEAVAEVAQTLSVTGLAGLELESAEELQLSLRAELAGNHPMLSLMAEAKVEGQVAASVGAPGIVTAKVRGYELKRSGSISLEVRAPLADPDAFLTSPVEYVRNNATSLRGSAEARATITDEKTVLHHSTITVATVSTKPSELQRVAQQLARSTDWRQVVLGLGEGVEVDVRERAVALKHAGIDAKVGAGNHLGFKAGAGYERKTLESERTLFRGQATDFAVRGR